MDWGENVDPLHLKDSDCRYKYNDTRVTDLLQLSTRFKQKRTTTAR